MERNIAVIPAKKKKHNVKSITPTADKIRLETYCRVSTDHEEQDSSFENQISFQRRRLRIMEKWINILWKIRTRLLFKRMSGKRCRWNLNEETHIGKR